MVISAPRPAMGSDCWIAAETAFLCRFERQITWTHSRLVLRSSATLMWPHYTRYVQTRASLALVARGSRHAFSLRRLGLAARDEITLIDRHPRQLLRPVSVTSAVHSHLRRGFGRRRRVRRHVNASQETTRTVFKLFACLNAVPTGIPAFSAFCFWPR